MLTRTEKVKSKSQCVSQETCRDGEKAQAPACCKHSMSSVWKSRRGPTEKQSSCQRTKIPVQEEASEKEQKLQKSESRDDKNDQVLEWTKVKASEAGKNESEWSDKEGYVNKEEKVPGGV